MNIEIAPSRKLMAALVGIYAFLALAGAAVYVHQAFEWSFPLSYWFDPLFDLDGERNIPAWFSGSLLLGAGLLLGLIARVRSHPRQRYRNHWLFLAVLFVLMSMDEIVGLHELVMHLMWRYMSTSGVFRFAWVIPAIGFVGVLGVLYFPFVLHLRRRARWLFVLSGGVYLAGAVGCEMLGGYVATYHKDNSALWCTIVVLEECLEMGGLLLFIHSLLDYMGCEQGGAVERSSGPRCGTGEDCPVGKGIAN